MARSGCAAAMLAEDRQDLAVQALAGSATITDLAARRGVSRIPPAETVFRGLPNLTSLKGPLSS